MSRTSWIRQSSKLVLEIERDRPKVQCEFVDEMNSMDKVLITNITDMHEIAENLKVFLEKDPQFQWQHVQGGTHCSLVLDK